MIIHIGYPKCASTTIQKHLFAKHPGINYLGIYPDSNVGYDSSDVEAPTLALDRDKTRQLHDLILSLELNESKKSDIEKVNEILASLGKDKINIISNERLTSSIFTGLDIKKNAKKLFYFFPNAKILMIVRDPFDWLLSQYRDQPFNPKDIVNSEFVEFDSWLEILFSEREDILESLKYDKIYNRYSDLFDKKDILILRLENLEDEYNRLGEFLNIPAIDIVRLMAEKKENRGTSAAFTRYRRFIRKFKGIIPDNEFTQNTKKHLNTLVKSLFSSEKRKIQYDPNARARVYEYFRDTRNFLNGLPE